MLVSDLESVLDSLAPFALAESWDNAGLQVGDPEAGVSSLLVALELTDAVLDEAVDGGFDTVVTHHPLLFAPVRSLLESRPRERLLRRAVKTGINVISCHTNLDSAPGGLADVVAGFLRLQKTRPLQPAPAGWYKLVGFVPPESVGKVASAVFAAGAGVIGEYAECAFTVTGQGWFTPGPEATPTIGRKNLPERAPEVRWETVVPRGRLRDVVWAYVEAHPYEEPAFNVFPVDDVMPRAGLGRVGELPQSATVQSLAARLAEELGLAAMAWSGDGARTVRRVAVVPGSGRSLLDLAAGQADLLVTGELGHHDAERAAEMGMALIDAPHGELEWFALQRWMPTLRTRLEKQRIPVALSEAWRSPWSGLAVDGRREGPDPGARARSGGAARLFVDGGSRGNPGPGAIGVILEDETGAVIDELGRHIGVTTNNVAEYQALLAGLEMAREHGIERMEIFSDSELLVKQMLGDYRVKSEGLKPLHEEATSRLGAFRHVSIVHVPREKNTEADRLLNEALNHAAAGEDAGGSGE